MKNIDYLNVPQVKLLYVDEVCNERMQIKTSSNACEAFRPFFSECMQHHEEVWIMLLNNRNRVLGVLNVGSGTTTFCVTNLKAILQSVILSNATHVILAHNHPSGGKEISHSDKAMTTQVKDMLKCIDIKLIEHIVLTYDSYFSFADEGLI